MSELFALYMGAAAFLSWLGALVIVEVWCCLEWLYAPDGDDE